MAHWTHSADADGTSADDEFTAASAVETSGDGASTGASHQAVPSAEEVAEALSPEVISGVIGPCGWPVPSSLCPNADTARSMIELPQFDDWLMERARVISSRFPLAEGEYRSSRANANKALDLEIPHFERVFRIAAGLANIPNVQDAADYDALLILTAWHTVRPGVEGFLGSYPKALLCPLSHAAPPSALGRLSIRERSTFQRR